MDGVGLIVGIDRFMSEARALTNFAGNSVATVLIGSWTGGLDRERLDRVLEGREPFDETTMLDDHGSHDDHVDHVDHHPNGAHAPAHDHARAEVPAGR